MQAAVITAMMLALCAGRSIGVLKAANLMVGLSIQHIKLSTLSKNAQHTSF
jgi:hypothetical protein